MLDLFLRVIHQYSADQKWGKRVLLSSDILFGDLGRILTGRLQFQEVKGVKQHLFGIKIRLQYYRNWLRHMKYAEKGEHDVLIHVTEKSHLSQLIPVYYELSKTSRVAFITTKVKLLDVLIDRKLPLSPVGIKLNPAMKFSLLPISKDLKRLNEEGIDTWGISKYLRICLPNVVATKFIYGNALNAAHPKALIVGNDLTFEGRMIARMANSMNIQTYSIQHGFIASDWLQRYHIVQTFFLYGNISKLALDNQLLSSTTTVVSGAPYLDGFSIRKIEESEELNFVLKVLKIEKGYFLICLSGHGHVTSKVHYLQILALLEKQIMDSPNQMFVIKLHPKELLTDYELFNFQRFENVRFILQNSELNRKTSIFTWLAGCKCLVTGNSATLYEAILMDRPVISIDLAQEYPDFNVRDYNAILYVKSEVELKQVFSSRNFENAELIKNMKILSQDYFYSESISTSAERISNLINKSIV